MQNNWCEHLDKVSKYTYIKYSLDNKDVTLKVQTWVCPECGVHGADTELVRQPAAINAAG